MKSRQLAVLSGMPDDLNRPSLEARPERVRDELEARLRGNFLDLRSKLHLIQERAAGPFPPSAPALLAPSRAVGEMRRQGDDRLVMLPLVFLPFPQPSSAAVSSGHE